MNYIDKLLEHEVYPNEIIKLFYMCPVSAETFEEYSKEHTLEEIGAYLGITRERVRQIEKETIQNLRLEYNKGAF